MLMNKKVVFEVIEHTHCHPDIADYRAFGVRAFLPSDDGPKEKETIWDISSERTKVEDFAAWCMRGEVHPRHLRAMVEDVFDLE